MGHLGIASVSGYDVRGVPHRPSRRDSCVESGLILVTRTSCKTKKKEVRILQKSRKNGQNRINTNTGTDKEFTRAGNHNLWDVIINGDLEEEPAPTTGETSAPPAPKTAKQLAARRNQERVKSILLLAIPDEYLLKFHNVADAKSL
ncbi:hypothetical protein Tco_0194592 [Tanacetum coccineum]